MFSILIDKFVYVMINIWFELGICLSYLKIENVVYVDEIEYWLVKVVLCKFGVVEGVEIILVVDIFLCGSGFGLLSVFIVGLFYVIYVYFGCYCLKVDFGVEVCMVEFELCGELIGK